MLGKFLDRTRLRTRKKMLGGPDEQERPSWPGGYRGKNKEHELRGPVFDVRMNLF